MISETGFSFCRGCNRREEIRRGSYKDGRNGKGCDFGYALAANSCEGVTGVDACTVAAS